MNKVRKTKKNGLVPKFNNEAAGAVLSVLGLELPKATETKPLGTPYRTVLMKVEREVRIESSALLGLGAYLEAGGCTVKPGINTFGFFTGGPGRPDQFITIEFIGELDAGWSALRVIDQIWWPRDIWKTANHQ